MNIERSDGVIRRQFSAYISLDLYGRLGRLALTTGKSKAALVERCLSEALDKIEEEAGINVGGAKTA